MTMNALLCALLAFPFSIRARKPNLIYFLADDLGYGELSPYGQKRILTPRLQKFADEGTVFTDAYAGAPICTPSRTTLLTGRTLGASPLKSNRGTPCGPVAGIKYYGSATEQPGLQPEKTCDAPIVVAQGQDTLPALLRAQGYRTAHVGKWMIGENRSVSTPAQLGFEYSFGTLDGANGWNYYPPWQFLHNASAPAGAPEAAGHQMVALADNGDQFAPTGQPWLCRGVFNASGHACAYNQDLYAEHAMAFIREHRDAPIFLYFAFHIPHADCGFDGNASAEAAGWGQPTDSDAPYSDKDWPHAERNHAAMISHMDGIVGDVVDLVDSLGLANDTLFLFTSDNGASNQGGHSYQYFDDSGPLRGAKGCTWEGGFREPWLIRWPGHVPAGRRSAVPWAAYDVLPTLLEAAGAPASAVPSGVQGQSVLDLFLGKNNDNDNERDPPPPRLLYWKFGLGCKGVAEYNPPHRYPSCCDYAFAARQGDWKVRWWSNPSVPVQLYDLANDLHEDTNVYAAHKDAADAIMKEARATYDVANPFWPDTPCTTTGTTPLKGPCEGED